MGYVMENPNLKWMTGGSPMTKRKPLVDHIVDPFFETSIINVDEKCVYHGLYNNRCRHL